MSRPATDRHELRVGAPHSGARLDRFIADAVAGLSRSRVKALILEGRLALGRQTITDPAYRVKPDQLFTLSVPPPVEARPKAEPIPLSIVYEDGTKNQVLDLEFDAQNGFDHCDQLAHTADSMLPLTGAFDS